MPIGIPFLISEMWCGFDQRTGQKRYEVILEERKKFKPNDIDKFTVVIWLEGDDPDCVNAIIGGEIKMHMTLVEEHILQEDEKPQDEF